MLMVVMIMYLSMSGDSTRLVSHSYTWASTAAYLTGTTPTILLLVAAVLFISAMLYMTYTDHTHIDTEIEIEIEIEITERSVDAANTVASTWKETKVLLPMLRILILVIFVWGVPVAVNFGYLQVRLHESEQNQTIAQYCVSVFKLVWTSVMSSKLSNSKMLMFGLDQKEHAQFLENLGGSSVGRAFDCRVPSRLSNLCCLCKYRTVTGSIPVVRKSFAQTEPNRTENQKRSHKEMIERFSLIIC
jgi:hypothetical protein